MLNKPTDEHLKFSLHKLQTDNDFQRVLEWVLREWRRTYGIARAGSSGAVPLDLTIGQMATLDEIYTILANGRRVVDDAS